MRECRHLIARGGLYSDAVYEPTFIKLALNEDLYGWWI